MYFFEEPLYEDATRAYLRTRCHGAITVLTPVVPAHLKRSASVHVQRALLDTFAHTLDGEPLLWYYTPMAIEFSRHIRALRVYDCMDELSMFAGAPPPLRRNEAELLACADVVFTGGRSLFYSKRRLHRNVHCFPSGVDAAHFAAAGRAEPEALRGSARPRIGFYGVLDERLDTAFVEDVARLLPDWSVVLVGPVVKIDPETLPKLPNIHYAGMQPYEALPALLEHWDVAFLPFARNDATRFISPTKTLEYLAAGKPVISTAIADVVDPYGAAGVVSIAETPAQAAQAARGYLADPPSNEWHAKVRAMVAASSWDATVDAMLERIETVREGAMERAG